MARDGNRWIELQNHYFRGRGPMADWTDCDLEAIVGPVDDLLTGDDLAAFHAGESADREALIGLLDSLQGRLIVKLVVFAARSVPEWLLEPLLRAGACTRDPSFNQHFIWPCVITHGRRKVMGHLLSLVKHGADAEKAGAFNALYWGSMKRQTVYWPCDDTDDDLDVDEDTEPVDDLMSELRYLAVTEFNGNTRLDVQRAAISWLPQKYDRDPQELQRAVERAMAHTDPYIRGRAAYQFGDSSLIPCYPPQEPSGGGRTS
jgi:hypothetical protein